MHKIIIIFSWILISRLCLLDQLKKSYMKLPIHSGANIHISIIRMMMLTVMNLHGIVKIFVMMKVISGFKKYSLPSTKVLGFVSWRVTSKSLGTGSAERSWGDVINNKIRKKIRSWKWRLWESEYCVYIWFYWRSKDRK